MEKFTMCRICLVENVRMHIVTDENLQETFQRLTNIPFVTEDSRPLLACFFCYARLKQCSRFMLKCLEADQVFTQIIIHDFELKPLACCNEYNVGFDRTMVENINIEGDLRVVNKELPGVHNTDDNIFYTQEEDDREGSVAKKPKKDLKKEKLSDVNSNQYDRDRRINCQNIDKTTSNNIVPLEQAAAFDLDVEEGDVPENGPYDKGRQWVSDLPTSGSVEGIHRSRRTMASGAISGVAGTVSLQAMDPLQTGPSGVQETSESATEEMDVLPSVSETTVQRCVAETAAEESEFDSDFDDDHNLGEIADFGRISRCIPDDEELDEPTSNIIHSVETAMDDAIDQLVGEPNDFNWSEDFETFRGVRGKFSGPTPGPTKDYDTPYDAFTAFWSEDIIEHIVKETNRNAKQVTDEQRQAGTLTQASRLCRWSDTDKDEIYMWFAVCMFMGLDPRTSQHEFWKSTGYLEMPKFRQLMTYNRHLLLNKFLNFEDNSDESPNAPSSEGNVFPAELRKVAPIVRHLNDKFSNLYHLHPDIAIDETLTSFKGRLSWVQPVRSEAARVGIKSCELCDPRTGYLYKFEIYAGKNSEQGNYVAASEALAGESPQIVINLLKGLENRGHCVTLGNFFNSPALARYLRSLGFDCLGRLRPNRKDVPLEIKNFPKTVANGTIVARHCGDVTCIAWKDDKVATMLSTYHNDGTFLGSKAGRALVKPLVVRDYEKTMGGLDLKDRKLSMFLFERERCVKWYMRMFKMLLNVSVHNAFILLSASLKRRNMPLITHRDFRERLANSLVERHLLSSRDLSAPVAEITRLRRDIVHVPKKEASNMRTRCHVCARNSKLKKTCFKCVTCNEFMCPEDCWRDWHSLQYLKGRTVLIRKGRRRQ